MILGFTPRHVWHRGEELFLNLNLLMNGASRHSPMCWMIPLTVGWNSSFIASQDIRSIPCEDHFTKFTLWVVKGTHKSTGQPGCLLQLLVRGPYIVYERLDTCPYPQPYSAVCSAHSDHQRLTLTPV